MTFGLDTMNEDKNKDQVLFKIIQDRKESSANAADPSGSEAAASQRAGNQERELQIRRTRSLQDQYPAGAFQFPKKKNSVTLSSSGHRREGAVPNSGQG